MDKKDIEFAGCFIKFGSLEHLIELKEKGILYCNPINYFIKIEDNFLRGDPMENVTEMMYMESGDMILSPVGEQPSINSTTLPFKDFYLKGRIIEPFGNLFCLTAINILEKPFGQVFTVNERNKEFGEYFLLIHNTKEFLNRIKEKLEQLKMRYQAEKVKYLDFSKFNGKKSVFEKDLIFSYQQEWRLFLGNKKDEPIKIDLGSLEELSILGSSKSIENLKIVGNKKNDDTITILSNLIPFN